MSNNTEYYTKCCHLYFVGDNHNPVMDLECRNCGWNFLKDQVTMWTWKEFKSKPEPFNHLRWESSTVVTDGSLDQAILDNTYESALKYGVKND